MKGYVRGTRESFWILHQGSNMKKGCLEISLAAFKMRLHWSFGKKSILELKTTLQIIFHFIMEETNQEK